MDPVRQFSVRGRSQVGALQANKVLRNTYLLLSSTLLFSAAVAGTSMALNLPYPGLIITLVGYFGLLFATERCADRPLGLVLVFALTGFMGYTLGPILNMYLHSFNHGGQLIMTALGGTGVIFFGLSAYTLVSGRRFQTWGTSLFIGLLVAFVLGIANIFFQMPALSLAVSALFMILCSGLILYQTAEIVHGGETNYIRATVILFVSLFNIFLSLLSILGFVGGRD